MNPHVDDVRYCPICERECRLVDDGDRKRHCPACGWVPGGDRAEGFDPEEGTAATGTVFRFDFPAETRYAVEAGERYTGVVVHRDGDVRRVEGDAGELMAWAIDATDVTRFDALDPEDVLRRARQ